MSTTSPSRGRVRTTRRGSRSRPGGPHTECMAQPKLHRRRRVIQTILMPQCARKGSRKFNGRTCVSSIHSETQHMQTTSLNSATLYSVIGKSRTNTSGASQVTENASTQTQSPATQPFDARGVSYTSTTGGYTITYVEDFLTSSDKDLFQEATGLTIKDEGTYDVNGNYSYTPGTTNLLLALSSMREMGVPGDNYTSTYRSGAFTASDINAYLKAYSGIQNFDDSDLVKAAQILNQKDI